MSATRFIRPAVVEFDHHRWYTDIIIVDRFGVTQRFRASADGEDTGGSGLAFFAIDEFGKDIDP